MHNGTQVPRASPSLPPNARGSWLRVLGGSLGALSRQGAVGASSANWHPSPPRRSGPDAARVPGSGSSESASSESDESESRADARQGQPVHGTREAADTADAQRQLTWNLKLGPMNLRSALLTLPIALRNTHSNP